MNYVRILPMSFSYRRFPILFQDYTLKWNSRPRNSRKHMQQIWSHQRHFTWNVSHSHRSSRHMLWYRNWQRCYQPAHQCRYSVTHAAVFLLSLSTSRQYTTLLADELRTLVSSKCLYWFFRPQLAVDTSAVTDVIVVLIEMAKSSINILQGQ